MKWIKTSVTTTHDGSELISNLFIEMGITGVEIDDPKLVNDYIDAKLWDYNDLPRAKDVSTVIVRAYLPDDNQLNNRLIRLKEGVSILKESSLFDLGKCLISQEMVADENWADSWKKYFHVEKIGERVVIAPTWEAYKPSENEIVIELDPGAAFGTGNHATTAMCIRYLENIVKPAMRVFDIGCGSGILSIVSSKLGVKEVLAVDYDPVAVRVAKENIKQNNIVGKIDVKESDLFSELAGKGTADIIIANIIADIIIRLLPDLDRYLAKGGLFLASGIISDREADVVEAVNKNGFCVIDYRLEKEWLTMLIRRRSEV